MNCSLNVLTFFLKCRWKVRWTMSRQNPMRNTMILQCRIYKKRVTSPMTNLTKSVILLPRRILTTMATRTVEI
ncbi:hypothetical protein Hanom_Chr07g00656291 [Helianthus anomalus]